jgi:osmotically-inducible protein OsmY
MRLNIDHPAERRTDVDIARSAENLLKGLKSVSCHSVKVKVDNGWLTLTGEVGSDYERQSAAAVVIYLLGVTGVSDEIRIRPDKFARRSGPDFAMPSSHPSPWA